MTLHAKIIGGAFALAMGLGVMSAPAMAQSHSQSAPQNCSIGETYNGGSLVDSHNSNHDGDRANNCYNIGR